MIDPQIPMRLGAEVDDLRAETAALRAELAATQVDAVGFGWLQDADKFGRGTKLYTHPQPDLTAEAEMSKAESDSFYMDYRMNRAHRITELEEAARKGRQMTEETIAAGPNDVTVRRQCTDERPCINCFADNGPCLGPYKQDENITCPFCGDDGYDKVGLKRHLQMPGWCEWFEKIDG